MGKLRQEGMPQIFNFGVGSDLKDSNKTLMQFDQGGISLPDRDNYLKSDPKSVEMREKYVEHVSKMFELAGDSPAGEGEELDRHRGPKPGRRLAA